MTAPPGPPPADQEPDRPTPGASKYSGPSEAPTSPPSSPEFVAHSASQAAQDGSPWASAPTRLLRPEEAAEYLALSRARVYELLAADQLESIHIGRSRRIPLAALDDFVTRLRAEGGCHTPRAS